MLNKQNIKMVMLSDGRVTIGLANNKSFSGHVEHLCNKYKTDVLVTRTFTPEQYETKKEACIKNGIVQYDQMIGA